MRNGSLHRTKTRRGTFTRRSICITALKALSSDWAAAKASAFGAATTEMLAVPPCIVMLERELKKADEVARVQAEEEWERREKV